MTKRTLIGGLFSGVERREQHGRFRKPLDQLNKVINWDYFRDEIEQAAQYSKIGRRAHDPVLMFKIIVLQRYYDLSEEQTEFQILDRLSFQQFLGLESGGKIPDKNAIWDFKERLGPEGIRGLFEHFDAYLAEAGLKASGGRIIDASFVDVPRQRNSREENEMIKEGKVPPDWSGKKTSHKDTDARWTRKNNERHFGYKNHVKVGAKTKLVERFEVTDAAVHDSQVFKPLLDKDTDKEIYADSAYRSRESSETLEANDIANKIHLRAYRNRPLNKRQKNMNTARSRIRARVEHTFGFQTKVMRSDRIRTIGIDRAKVQIGLSNLVYNLFRFAQLNCSMI